MVVNLSISYRVSRLIDVWFLNNCNCNKVKQNISQKTKSLKNHGKIVCLCYHGKIMSAAWYSLWWIISRIFNYIVFKKPQNLTKNMDRKRLDTVPFLSLIGNNTPPAIFPETWKCKLQTISKRDARLDATL